MVTQFTINTAKKGKKGMDPEISYTYLHTRTMIIRPEVDEDNSVPMYDIPTTKYQQNHIKLLIKTYPIPHI